MGRYDNNAATKRKAVVPAKSTLRPSTRTVATVQPCKSLSVTAPTPKAPASYVLRISNVVCTAWAGQTLSLRFVQLASQGRLDAKVFPSNVSRGRAPTTTNSIFDTGRILVTGAPSVWNALYASKQYVDKLNKELSMDLRVLNFKVQNIVCSFSLGYRLDMHRFHAAHRVTSTCTSHYQPQLFRGCSWILLTGLVFVLFESGKIVLTGARTWNEAEAAYKKALPELALYKQQHAPVPVPTVDTTDRVVKKEAEDEDLEDELGDIIENLQRTVRDE